MDEHTWERSPQTARGLRTLRSGLGQLFEREPQPFRVMPPDEALARVAICARILDAWPNARPMNRDRTLVEYVNATRGVPLASLPACIQHAIDAGGDFMPPAGEVLRRAAVQALGGPVIGTDRDAHFWHEKRVADTLAAYRPTDLLALDPERPLVGQVSGHYAPSLPQGETIEGRPLPGYQKPVDRGSERD